MHKGFWSLLTTPIIGLAPMDGVTDAAFRYITDTYGKPDILFTEFTSVEGITRGADTLLQAFIHHTTDTPTVAQIFGTTPEAFYKVAFILAEMGFDGIDINMGCPDRNVAKQGGGAALILKPVLAQEIIRKTMQGALDWAEGRNITQIDLPPRIIAFVETYKKQYNLDTTERKILPVSVKTRIGYDKIVTTEWISTLLETEVANISLHGRTLKQLYTGEASWAEIAKAAEVVRKTNTIILGNGDIKSLSEAKEKIQTYHTHGALIGRAAFGNPWIFKDITPDPHTKLETALEHCRVFERMTPDLHFLSLRKHMAWYCKGFEHAQIIRSQLMTTKTYDDVEKVIKHAQQILAENNMIASPDY
ncbi:MAG: hypothetical protein RI947_144 [Candidatus Parcubacteria bacterium]|jgi:tRNA-dihydrouridine synthase